MKKATKIVLSIIGTLSTLGIGSAITIGIANKDLQEKNNSENTSSFQVAYEKEQEQKNELIDLSTDETSYDRKVQLQSNLNMVDNNMK
jgi:hypothetical protein